VATELGRSLTLVASPVTARPVADPRPWRVAGAMVVRILVMVVGGMAPAIALSWFLAAFLPGLGPQGRFTAGYLLMLPLWLTAICLGFLIRTGRAALAFLVITAAAAGMVYLFR
jgi:hypothetical protein